MGELYEKMSNLPNFDASLHFNFKAALLTLVANTHECCPVFLKANDVNFDESKECLLFYKKGISERGKVCPTYRTERRLEKRERKK
jgi:hypothetical protein